MKKIFDFNVPAYNTINGETGMYIPVIAYRVAGSTYWDIGQCESWKLVNIKSWLMLNAEVETRANILFAEQLNVTA